MAIRGIDKVAREAIELDIAINSFIKRNRDSLNVMQMTRLREMQEKVHTCAEQLGAWYWHEKHKSEQNNLK